MDSEHRTADRISITSMVGITTEWRWIIPLPRYIVAALPNIDDTPEIACLLPFAQSMVILTRGIDILIRHIPGGYRMAQQTAPGSERIEVKESTKDVDRIAAFSDAIFAFSMTVLTVDIKVPVVTGDLSTALPQAIIQQIPHLLSFVAAFLVVAMYWSGHHRMFRHIRRVDGRLIWMNILLLMLIAFMPVPTGYLGEYTNVPLIEALYASVLIAISLVSLMLWRHAASAQLLDPHLHPRLISLYQWRSLVPAFVFAVSILVAYTVGAIVAELGWILIWPITLLFSRQYRDVTPQIYGDI